MRVDTIEKFNDKLSPIESLIGTQNLEDVRKRIGDLIVRRVQEDINTYDSYMFYPEDYTDVIDEAFEKTQKKINKMYQDAMLEVAQKAVEKFKEVALKGIEQSLENDALKVE